MKWEKVRLDEIVKLTKGKKHKEVNNHDAYRYIQIEDLHGTGTNKYTFESGILCNTSDVLIAWDGANAGKVGIGLHGMVGSTLAKISITSPLVSSRYLYWYLSSNFEVIKSKRTGATIPHVNGSELRSMNMPLPPLHIQEQIADTLDKADALRRKDQELLQKYDELAQAIFYDMFGDPVKNDKSWTLRSIGSLSEVSSGATPSREKDEYYGGDIPWVKTGEVNGKRIFKTEETLSLKGIQESSCKIYPSGSIIVAMYGQGKTRGQVGYLECQATTNQACAVIKPSLEIDSNYLFYLLKYSYNNLRDLGRGGNQANLNAGMVKSYFVMLPPDELQDLFKFRIKQIEEQAEIINKSIKCSILLFESIIKEYFL